MKLTPELEARIQEVCADADEAITKYGLSVKQLSTLTTDDSIRENAERMLQILLDIRNQK